MFKLLACRKSNLSSLSSPIESCSIQKRRYESLSIYPTYPFFDPPMPKLYSNLVFFFLFESAGSRRGQQQSDTKFTIRYGQLRRLCIALWTVHASFPTRLPLSLFSQSSARVCAAWHLSHANQCCCFALASLTRNRRYTLQTVVSSRSSRSGIDDQQIPIITKRKLPTIGLSPTIILWPNLYHIETLRHETFCALAEYFRQST